MPALRDEQLLSWNIPNFISVALMLALIWCALGFLGHMVFRKPSTAAKRSAVAPGLNAMAVPPSTYAESQTTAAGKQADQPSGFEIDYATSAG